MAIPDFAALLEPVSSDEPCGPDLDDADDPDFLQAVARLEGLLPASFFTRDDDGQQQPFDRSTIDFAAELKQLAALLEKTRDLRLLTLYCRLSALNRDLDGLEGCLRTSASLLRDRWDEVHPRGDGGDYPLRMATLGALDDVPTMVLPLQYIPLVQHKRLGSVTFRNVMAANGEVSERPGDQSFDRGSIERALTEADLDALRARHDRLVALRDDAAAIRAITVERAGFEQSVSLERVEALLGRMIAVLHPAIVARDPSAGAALPAPSSEPDGDAGASPAAPVAVGSIASLAQAAASLDAIVEYLHVAEPSGPAELLVRQAAGLVGKSFVEVLRILVPSYAEETTISIGPDRAFALSFAQLSAVSDGAERSAPAAEPAPSPVSIGTRAEALETMRAVGAYFRRAEPSSPIPLLLERAAGMVDRDFLAILRDVLPMLSKVDGS